MVLCYPSLQGCHNSNEPKFKAILKVCQGFLANFQGSYIARKFNINCHLQGFTRTKYGLGQNTLVKVDGMMLNSVFVAITILNKVPQAKIFLFCV